jgi:NAD(P)-dependent dehydrogenase (short-subunit alcohol dehydrogenase family)
MQLQKGQVAVVTGAASGIGFALANGFAQRGMNVVLADVQDDALAEANDKITAHGVETLAVKTDVSKEEAVQSLAKATLERFGSVHVVCNNAGVAGGGDAWLGPLATWEWVLGVNLWGVVHGIRAFLPHLLTGGHFVNTASIAGLMPGFSASYDASKHAVVAMSEALHNDMTSTGMPVGVSVLCPGWVRTGILDAERNWPDELGPKPETNPMGEVARSYVRRALDEGTTPAAIADAVLSAVEANRFWVIPHQDFLDLCVRRWERIADRLDPDPPEQVPGMPPRAQLIEEMMAALNAALAAQPAASD